VRLRLIERLGESGEASVQALADELGSRQPSSRPQAPHAVPPAILTATGGWAPLPSLTRPPAREAAPSPVALERASSASASVSGSTGSPGATTVAKPTSSIRVTPAPPTSCRSATPDANQLGSSGRSGPGKWLGPAPLALAEAAHLKPVAAGGALAPAAAPVAALVVERPAAALVVADLQPLQVIAGQEAGG
jgi:hypothetical protein